ncbi:MAG: TfoX/Sxy family protein [Candidatus Hydrogenedentes bacterium]|nr:TfoX/Sxy family protein [Candidatus Hydrogenedentota bacterium]
MPFDPGLAARLEEIVTRDLAHYALTETRMFGGFGYLLQGNMCFGIHKDTLIVRVGEETAAKLIKIKHVRPMDLTGRIMKAWATIEPEGMASDKDLLRFCKKAVTFVQDLPAKT